MGEGAFSANLTNGSALDILAVHGSRVFQMRIVGAGAALYEREISLMQAPLGHS
jgi:hypothetical protein